MKKNLVFKLGLFCAALVLVATCFVTNAWAKYTRTVTATDSARVAKFFVSLNAKENSAIETYELDIFKTNIGNILITGDENSDGTDRLIAPGSKGSFNLVCVSKSEVDVQFTFEVDDEQKSGIPLKWKVSGDGVTNPDEQYDTLTAALASISALNSENIIEADDDDTNDQISYVVSWEWVTVTDKADTDLGTAGTAEYSVSLTISATQVVAAP